MRFTHRSYSHSSNTFTSCVKTIGAGTIRNGRHLSTELTQVLALFEEPSELVVAKIVKSATATVLALRGAEAVVMVVRVVTVRSLRSW